MILTFVMLCVWTPGNASAQGSEKEVVDGLESSDALPQEYACNQSSADDSIQELLRIDNPVFYLIDVPALNETNLDEDVNSTVLSEEVAQESEAVSSDGNESIEWAQSTHSSIAHSVASTSALIDPRWWDTLQNEADTPDDWYYPWFPYWDSVYHYVDTGAPYYTRTKAEDAIGHFRDGDIQDGYEHMAWASHYLMDMGNPYHACGIDFAELIEHTSYESWISAHWSDGVYNLANDVLNKGACSYMQGGGDLEDLAIDLASRTAPYQPVCHQYLVHGTSFDEFLAGVRQCLTWTAQYVAALYLYVAPNWLRTHEVHDVYPYAEVHGIGDTLLKGANLAGKFHIRVVVYTASTSGDTSTDYLDFIVHLRSGGYVRYRFYDLPEANGGYLLFERVVDYSGYYMYKIEQVEFVWHQWTSGNTWHLYDSTGETWYASRVTVEIEGYGVHQTSATYYEALGKTFGDDSSHVLNEDPVTAVKLHLELSIAEPYGDIVTDYLYIWVRYTDGTNTRWTKTSLPMANGGTISYDTTIYPSTVKQIDYVEFLWHQWTRGQSSGHTWYIRAATTFYWDVQPSLWPT